MRRQVRQGLMCLAGTDSRDHLATRRGLGVTATDRALLVRQGHGGQSRHGTNLDRARRVSPRPGILLVCSPVRDTLSSREVLSLVDNGRRQRNTMTL